MYVKTNRADLRIVVHAANTHAVVLYASLRGHDVYFGPRLNVGKQLFRHSYHESGKSHLRIPTSAGRAVMVPGVPLEQVKGKHRLGEWSSDLRMLKWGYKPELDSATRRTKILDLDSLSDPSLTTALWAFEPGRPELMVETLDFYMSGGVVIAQLLADWCTPNLLAVAWTLAPESWAALARSRKLSDSKRVNHH